MIKSKIDSTVKKEKIAARKKVASERWWKFSLNTIEQGIIITKEDGSIWHINTAAEKILGTVLEECKGQNYLDVYKVYKNMSDEDFICTIQDPDLVPEILTNNNWLIDCNNNHIPIEETVTEITDENNNFIGKIITIKNVSKKRKNQLAVVSSRNFYISLLEDFPVPVWRANAEGYFNYFNKTWLDITGRNLEHEIHFGWLDGIHPEEKMSVKNVFESSFAKKERFECEFRLLNKEQKYNWIFTVGTPFNDVHKKFGGYILAGIDLTKKKILEKELWNTMIKAEAASRAKSTFIANMSHEIRTPLNGIVGLTDLLFDTALSPDQHQYLEMVKQSSKVLLELLNNLIDQSKLEVGKLSVQESVFSLNEIIDEIWESFATQAEHKNIIAEKRFYFDTKNKFIGDKVKMQQIVTNLLTNALKFTDEGKIDLQFFSESIVKTDTTQLSNHYLHIVVKDTGIGIPDDQHERIFESFTQVDSSSTKKYPGAGLGLSIVKNLVELFHGKIWFESKEGVGSEFHVLLALDYVKEINATQLNN